MSSSAGGSAMSAVRPAASSAAGGLPGLVVGRRRARAVGARCAFGRGERYGGALVDEGMSVLRRRIREARMAETNYEAPPSWAPWEKRYYPAYVSDVSALAGALQLLLMGTRPGVALAAAALVLGSVPFSAVAALHHLGLAAESVLHHVS